MTLVRLKRPDPGSHPASPRVPQTSGPDLPGVNRGLLDEFVRVQQIREVVRPAALVGSHEAGVKLSADGSCGMQAVVLEPASKERCPGKRGGSPRGVKLGKPGAPLSGVAILMAEAPSRGRLLGRPAGPAEGDSAVNGPRYEVLPIGWVESSLVERAQAPRQGNEGAPPAWLVFEPQVAEGIRDLGVGDLINVLTWLDRARRDVLSTHPRNDPASPQWLVGRKTGVNECWLG